MASGASLQSRHFALREVGKVATISLVAQRPKVAAALALAAANTVWRGVTPWIQVSVSPEVTLLKVESLIPRELVFCVLFVVRLYQYRLLLWAVHFCCCGFFVAAQGISL